MQFRSINIEKRFSSDKFEGQIKFRTSNGDSIYLNLDDEFSKKAIELCLPLFEKATNEKIEFIKKELGLEMK